MSRLLGCGADPSAKSRDGGTAADWARRFGHEDIARTLDQARLELDRLASAEVSAMSLSSYQLAADPDEVDLDLAAALLHWIVSTRAEEVRRESGEALGPDGAVLVFLPGWHEISQLRDALEADPRFGKDVLVLPLHSMVPPAEQKRVFRRPPPGVKKIVLATNIAETAVTIDDVVFVVDSGRLKEKSYDAHTGVSTLQAAWISRASAQQRRGRARVACARASVTACTPPRAWRRSRTSSCPRCSARRWRSSACRCACWRRRPAWAATAAAPQPPWARARARRRRSWRWRRSPPCREPSRTP